MAPLDKDCNKFNIVIETLNACFHTKQYVALSQESAANLSAPEAILMDQESFQRSEEFKMNHIQPRVLQDWYENDAHLLNNWLRFAERFRPSHEVGTFTV